MRKYFKIMAVMILVVGLSLTAYAGEKYRDDYTYEDSTGNWYFTGNLITSGGGLQANTYFKPPVIIVTATPATVTTAEAGTTYIIAANSLATPAMTITSITLPPASGTTSQVIYKFMTDGSSLVLRPSDEARDNVFIWSSDLGVNIIPVGQKQLRIAISAGAAITTGSTVDVVMGSNVWYVSANTETSIDVETLTDLW